jgi:ABC-type dipeptide/oligopeptide/nickel transport system ATPase component
MPGKTDQEIVQAHKIAIEAYTGKHCVIILQDRIDRILPLVSLADLANVIEMFNPYDEKITSKTTNREVIALKKIFCALAVRAGYSAKVSAKMLNQDRSTISYSLKSAQDLISSDSRYRGLYNDIQAKIIDLHEYRLKNLKGKN